MTVERERAMEILADFTENYAKGAQGCFRVGHRLAIPASPQGLADLTLLREAVLKANATPLSELDVELSRALSRGDVRIRTMGWDRERRGFVYGLTGPFIGVSLPMGDSLPDPILRGSLAGQLVTDCSSLMSSIGACEEGTIDFLDEFSVEYETETEGGCCCGENCYGDEGVSLCYVEDFTISADMIEYIDNAGFLDKLADQLDCEIEDEDLCSHIKGMGVSGDIPWDTSVWDYTPDYAAVLAEQEYVDVYSVLPELVGLVGRFRKEGLLPPIPGTLTHKRNKARFLWNPDAGTFTQPTGEVRRAWSIDGSVRYLIGDRYWDPIVCVSHWNDVKDVADLAQLKGLQLTI